MTYSRKKKDVNDMLASLRSAYAILGRRPTAKETSQLCIASYRTYGKYFGGIEGACLAAGLPDYCTELALQLRRVSLELGHIPSTTEICKKRHQLKAFAYNVGAYLNEFGSWRMAIAASMTVPDEFIYPELVSAS